jgi:hypothetical protein
MTPRQIRHLTYAVYMAAIIVLALDLFVWRP